MTLTDLQLNQLAGLNAGRYPAWQTGEPYLGGGDNPCGLAAPGDAGAGVDVSEAQLALVAVALRRRPDRDTLRLAITWSASGQTYSFMIDGETYTYTAAPGTSALAIATALAAEVFLTGDGYVATSILEGDVYNGVTTSAIDVWAIDGSRPPEPTSETNVSAVDRDADGANITLWGLPDGLTTWCQIGQTAALEITANWQDLVRVSPLSRLYVQITKLDRTSDYKDHVVVSVGVCQSEPG